MDTLIRGVARAVTGLADKVTSRRVSILIFHRVLPRPDPIFPGEMDATRFDRLMGIVARAFNVLTLGQALALRAEGRLPPRALVITFDDGYADNAEVALPILRRHGLRATFFVSTGFLDGGRMWNDTVIESVRASARPILDLDRFNLGSQPVGTFAQKRAAIELLLPKLKYMSLIEREKALTELREVVGSRAPSHDLMMSTEQVRQLHRAGMEIGGHTVHHPILRVLPDAEARAEIAEGRERLQEIIDAPVSVFAYPNGRPGQDYDARHVDMVRRMGFAGAVSTSSGVALGTDGAFELPRFTPWDLSPARWVGRLVHQRLGRHH
jgi:peptidoglycan/xylan/chitin deacetylase (PgdA/CDA1 family)